MEPVRVARLRPRRYALKHAYETRGLPRLWHAPFIELAWAHLRKFGDFAVCVGLRREGQVKMTQANSIELLFDKEFTLVTGPLGQDWLEAGKRASEMVGLPITLRTMPRVDYADGFRMGQSG